MTTSRSSFSLEQARSAVDSRWRGTREASRVLGPSHYLNPAGGTATLSPPIERYPDVSNAC